MKNITLIATIAALLLAAARLCAADFPQWDGRETVAEYAKRANLAPALTLDLGGDVKWEGVLIPAGTFVMGSPAGEAKTPEQSAMEKQHKVAITRPFYLGKFELTQAQYEKVAGENPSGTKGADLPVHNVSWQNAQDFCTKLSKLAGRDVQLPTEAQWEYACRAGTSTAYHTGNAIEDLDKAGWYGANSGGRPHRGGEKVANGWGVFDMHGNIREFTRDHYDGRPLDDASDPAGPKDGDPNNHVVRGGAYSANVAVVLNCRAAIRKPTESLAITGFRVLIALPAP